MAADGIRKTAVRETQVAQDRAIHVTAKRNDILSQLLTIMQQKKGSLSLGDIHVEMWAAV